MNTEKKSISAYKKIREDIELKIRSGAWKKGERMPSKKDFCKEYDVSLITINAALKNLKSEKMIELKRGSGTYVLWSPENDYYINQSRSRSDQKTVTITHSLVGALPMYKYMMRQLAMTFMNVNPHIKIEFINLPSGKEIDPYLERITNGSLPTCGDFFWHSVYAKLDVLYPLDELSGFNELKKLLIPQAYYPTLNGDNIPHIHALYLYLGIPSFILVNMSLLEQLGLECPQKPLSWTQFFKLLRLLSTRKTNSTFYASALPMPNAWHNVKYYLEIIGQEIFSKEYNPNSFESFKNIFNSAGALDGLELIGRIRDSGKIIMNKTNENFAMGNVGILPFSSAWTINLLDSLNLKMRYYTCRMPAIEPCSSYRSFHAGFSIGIFRNGITSDAQLDAAWNWLKFLFHNQSQYQYSQTINLPTRAGVLPYMQESNPSIYALAREIMNTSVPQPDFVSMRQAFTVMGQQLVHYLHGKCSAKECLDNIRLGLQYLS